MDLNGFSIYEQIEPVNHDITISFNPDNTYKSYILQIKKDNEIYKEIRKINTVPTEITLSETGTYEIEVKYHDENEIEYQNRQRKAYHKSWKKIIRCILRKKHKYNGKRKRNR